MTQRHTPGPWKVEDWSIINPALFGSDRTIATHVDSKANARLIAAAPELYDVARAPKIEPVGSDWYFCLEIPGRGGWSVKIPEEMRPFFEAWNDARRAAIAKAKSKS